MSECFWASGSGRKEYWPSLPLLPCESSVSMQKNPDQKKINKAKQKRKGWWVEFYYTIEGFCRRNELVKKEMAFGFYYFFYDGCKVLFSSQICLFWNRTFPVLSQSFPFFQVGSSHFLVRHSDFFGSVLPILFSQLLFWVHSSDHGFDKKMSDLRCQQKVNFPVKKLV